VTGTFRPGRRLACLVVLAALPLTACAAGYQAETSRERTSLTSVSSAIGDLTLTNMFFWGPVQQGGRIPLYLSIFNAVGRTDQLVAISSPGASGGIVPTNNTIPAGGTLVFNRGNPDAPKLTGLKRNALVAQTITVTLTFARAGVLVVQVPVEGPIPTTGP
jgi:copper(I)-binding protein